MKRLLWGLGLWLVLSLVFMPPTVKAQELLFEDDFSNGFAKWDVIRNSEQYWAISEGQAEATIPTRSTLAEMIPNDMYWSSDWKNIEYHVDYTPLEGFDKNISFGFENVANWYEVHFLETTYNLVRVQNGTTPFNIFNPYLMANGQTYHVKIIFNEGHILIYVNNELIGDEIDTSFNNNHGKIGIKAGTGAIAPTKVRFDNVKVYAVDTVTDFSLNVTHLLQTDPAWKDQEYDHASLWSTNPTIQRWGCALTAMTMIMNYHGLTHLPDHTLLTPLTLNNWLNNQSDGYIGDGNLNWLAITRLTRLIHEQFGTPKLEYRRLAGSDLNIAKNEITNQKPVVLHIDGHFMVADGITADDSDLLLKDPLAAHETFTAYQQPLVSTRTFKPSFTDLSYVLLTHSPVLELWLTTEDGQPVTEAEGFSDTITDAEDPTQKNPPLIEHYLAQPETSSYQLHLKQSSLSPFAVTVYFYDQQGNVTQKEVSGVVGPQAITFLLTYSRDGQQVITPTANFNSFRSDLALVKNQQQFIKLYSFYVLDELARHASKAPKKQQRLWATFLQWQLFISHRTLKPVGYSYLYQQLAALKSTL